MFPLTAYNLRSFGGLTAKNGRKIRQGMIYRSGTLEAVNGKFLKIVKSLHLRTLIDLRPTIEHSRKATPLKNTNKIVIPFDIDKLTRERLSPFLKKKGSVDEIIRVLESVYNDMVELLKPSLPALFDALEKKDNYPVLIHCRAGKDRTGFASAIILSAIGVPEETIVVDYMQTNQWLNEIKRKKMWLIWFLTFGRYPAKNLEAAFMVREQYIRLVLNKIQEDYGGIEDYLISSGIDQQQIKSIQDMLLEN